MYICIHICMFVCICMYANTGCFYVCMILTVLFRGAGKEVGAQELNKSLFFSLVALIRVLLLIDCFL